MLAEDDLGLPNLSGGAIGYLSFDCIRYFEPKTDQPLQDNLGIPEALFMLYDTIVTFDHYRSTVIITTHMTLPETPEESIQPAYDEACTTLRSIADIIEQAEIPYPDSSINKLNIVPKEGGGQTYTSNTGRQGYEAYVSKLKEHINKGDIIQAVPSQRLSRKTSLHPFNLYRTLRTLNPSPYMFFLSCADFHLVGASPECLMNTDGYAPLPSNPRSLRPRILNHAIAGTIARGKTTSEDAELAAQLQRSEKDISEHVTLLDLARNDLNRVCDPLTVNVNRLMRLDRYSHVYHLTSEISGLLRPEFTRWDALRSIFPCGTVSGDPKVRAVELVYDLEQEKRGVYAGGVGWIGNDVLGKDGMVGWACRYLHSHSHDAT